MKIWTIPVNWQLFGTIEVEAETLEDALDIAEQDGSIGLPDGEYMDGSWDVEREDESLLNELNKENLE